VGVGVDGCGVGVMYILCIFVNVRLCVWTLLVTYFGVLVCFGG